MKCDWCYNETSKLNKVITMGSESNICDDCKKHMDSGTCISCNNQTGMNSIKGRCLFCAQADYFDKKKEEESNLEEEVLKLDNGVEFTEKDFAEWLTFGQGNFSTQTRSKDRHNWIRKKLKNNFYWTDELIEKSMQDIEKIMDRNFSTLAKSKYSLLYIDKNYDMKKIKTCVDKENNVILIEVE